MYNWCASPGSCKCSSWDPRLPANQVIFVFAFCAFCRVCQVCGKTGAGHLGLRLGGPSFLEGLSSFPHGERGIARSSNAVEYHPLRLEACNQATLRTLHVHWASLWNAANARLTARWLEKGILLKRSCCAKKNLLHHDNPAGLPKPDSLQESWTQNLVTANDSDINIPLLTTCLSHLGPACGKRPKLLAWAFGKARTPYNCETAVKADQMIRLDWFSLFGREGFGDSGLI